MKRRAFFGSVAAAAAGGLQAAGKSGKPLHQYSIGCDCSLQVASAVPPGLAAFKNVGSKLRITGMKTFGVTLDAKIGRSDRPYVFVKLETNQGIVGWGEATLEGKAGAAMACANDLHDFIVGSDPMQSEHLYQLMYIGSFYRGGPVLGSAISGIDQAIWDPGQSAGHACLPAPRWSDRCQRGARILSRASPHRGSGSRTS